MAYATYVKLNSSMVEGTLWTWGQGITGGLGNNSTLSVSTPVTTAVGGTNWKQVCCSDQAGAGIKTDGTLWTWGSSLKLGNNSSLSVSTPVTTAVGGTNWKQLSVGRWHAGAVKTDGTLWMWGGLAYGELGHNSTSQVSTPVTTAVGGTNWKQVACQAMSSTTANTAAIKTDGTLWTWGSGTNGRLGNNSTLNVSTPVTTAVGGTNWKQVACGSRTVSAIKTDGTLWIWGDGQAGGLGNNSTLSVSTPITTAVGGTNWKQVSCGHAFSGAIKTDGTLWLWGSGGNGQLGNNSTSSVSTPVTTAVGGTNWKQICCSEGLTGAIKTDGTLWMCGYNGNGQLGNNSTLSVSTPVTTAVGGTNWKQVMFTYITVGAVKFDGL